MLKFCKKERLTNKAVIGSLFSKGKSLYIYPFNIKWSIIEVASDYPAQILISIPKRNFKKSVDRNKLKRLIREAYRINKPILFDKINKPDKQLVFTLIYSGKEILNFKFIETKIILILNRLILEHEKNTN